MYFEPPQLAYWDAAKHNWRLDAFADSQYNEGKNERLRKRSLQL